MRAQDEKIKGFNLVELLVVVVLIGIVSGLAYPNFSKWRTDREVRDAVFRIKSLIEGINAQVQRGQYVFVQVKVEDGGNANPGLIITSKGMSPAEFAPLLNNNESDWWTDIPNRCNIEDPDYWTHDPELDGNDTIEVRTLDLENVSTAWTGGIGAVCFGKNERWFNGHSNLVSGTGENAVVDNFLFICDRRGDDSTCNIENGVPITEHKNLFAIEWSRFGNISVDKWKSAGVVDNPALGDWVRQ